MRVIEDAPGAVEAFEERGTPPRAGPDGQTLFAGNRLCALGKVFGAEQLPADGAGDEVFTGVGPAGIETGDETAEAWRSDNANLG